MGTAGSLVGAAMALALAGCSASGSDDAGTDPAVDQFERVTAKVARGDLIETTTISGELEYVESRDLVTLRGGIVTRLPAHGKVIDEGRPLYRLDTEPVLRLNGRIPAWRDLGLGVSDGTDVLQLERALERMGYTDDLGMGVDRDWTWVTTIAVTRWQEDLGIDENGELPLGTVVFTHGDVRVVNGLVDAGTQVQPGTAVLQVSDTQRAVTVSLQPTEKNLAPVGGKLDLTFPDGTTAKGTVTEVVTVPGSQEEQTEDSLAVTVSVPDKKKVDKQLDGTSVQVELTYPIAEGVLTVPVTALVALANGGYGVEKVASDGTTSYVAVTPGSFADTTVEIVDGELAEGDEVVVTP